MALNSEKHIEIARSEKLHLKNMAVEVFLDVGYIISLSDCIIMSPSLEIWA